MENNKVTSKIHRGEIWTIAVLVTIFTWLVVLTLVTAFWDQLCARIMINALEYGMEQTLTPRYSSAIPPMQDRRPASRRPSTPKHKTLEDHLEDTKAYIEQLYPSETLDEMMERIDREAREWHPELFKDSDANE